VRRVAVYTMNDDPDVALRCLTMGCATVITKATDKAEDRPRLTDREQEVLLTWFQCDSKQLVAARCGLSPRTVEGYIDRVRVRYARAGRPAPTKAALVARALQDGLIRLDEL